MSLLSLILPVAGQPDATEDVKVTNALSAIQTWANGSIDGVNLSAAGAQSAGVNQSGQVVKGSSLISANQSTSSNTFVALATPDQVSNVVLGASGLILVWYYAVWQSSASGAGQAAVFLNGNQIKIPNTGGDPVVAAPAVTTGASQQAISSCSTGLTSETTNYSGNDVATGQIIGGGSVGNCVTVWAAAGTYTVTVKFLATSGTVAALNRRLYVQALSFA